MHRFFPALSTRLGVRHTPKLAYAQVRLNVLRQFSSSTPSETFLDRAEVNDRVLDVLKNFPKVDSNKVTADARFVDDLSLDSLDVVEVIMAMEDEFVIEIPDQEAERLTTPAQVVEFIAAHPMAK
jgi:NADH dehydrogenase (ubiquinone) 1 alpha/beta subcomplex 1